jgi:hypothetical protein
MRKVLSLALTLALVLALAVAGSVAAADYSTQITAMGTALGADLTTNGPAIVGAGLIVFGGLAAIGLVFRALRKGPAK